jgi:hypothetical protein
LMIISPDSRHFSPIDDILTSPALFLTLILTFSRFSAIVSLLLCQHAGNWLTPCLSLNFHPIFSFSNQHDWHLNMQYSNWR